MLCCHKKLVVTHPLITDSSLPIRTYTGERREQIGHAYSFLCSSSEEQGNQVIPFLGRERSSSSFETCRLDNYYEALLTMTNYFNQIMVLKLVKIHTL